MKKVIIGVTLILTCTTLAAQPPMGEGRGGRPQGAPRGNRPPMDNQKQQGENFIIMGLSEIPDLKLEQREKLSKAISDERKDISKLMLKKQDLKIEADHPGMAEKSRQKLIGKMDKLDEDIKKKKGKYDKKYRSILSDEQYKIFEVNKENIEFKIHKPREARPNREGRQGPPPHGSNRERQSDMPERDMF